MKTTHRSPAMIVPPINIRQRIPQEAIDDVVKQIADKFDPLQIILFGSYGQPKQTSDVDLLVVMNTQLKEMQQVIRICQALKCNFGVDLIVRTPNKLAQRLAWGDFFLREITNKGKVVYESSPTCAQTSKESEAGGREGSLHARWFPARHRPYNPC